MNKDDLWIGDLVLLLKSKRIGTYEGVSGDGRAKVKLRQSQKIVLTSFSNLGEFKEREAKKVILPLAESRKVHTHTEIDLHISKLSPDLEHEAPQIILNKQISVCKEFVEDMIAQWKLECLIIHGVGTGALRMEIAHLLRDYPQVIVSSLVHNGGATLVRFSY